ncbi:MAG: twin-arginine translocase TatA/TatE family subunit [Acidobacteria bacterium]|nr:twin-arginine translocase TatA/TatE family subunit [Acidobacteriota bacterium]
MGLGMPEVILILVVALIVFGPRKLPELGKTLGQAMSQFRRASDDFKRTWEQEVEMDKYRGSTTENTSSHDSTASNDYNETYNPYSGEYESGDNSSAQLNEPQQANAVETQETTSVEPATAGAHAPTTSDAKQQHWI